MILTAEKILENYREGKIVIDPFVEDLVSINSVDVRLGVDLWTPVNTDSIRDLYSPNDTEWLKVKPITAGDIRKRGWCPEARHPNWCPGVPDDHPCFYLDSGKFYLATTLEAVGAINDGGETIIVPEMKAKSTTGRQGLTVATCAGLGDAGFVSRWALEVRVGNVGAAIPIAVGTPIAQVVFHEAHGTAKNYNGKDRYQHDGEVRFLPKAMKVVMK